jgi:CheY-like chemotaxis protein
VTKRVLIVEDEPSVIGVLQEFLSQPPPGLTYEVEAVPDGAAAIMKLLLGQFDLVLLDMHMPRMGGLELLKQMRSLNIRVPVVMITANQDIRNAAEALSEGVFAYVPKPFDFARLEHLVALALSPAPQRPGGATPTTSA